MFQFVAIICLLQGINAAPVPSGTSPGPPGASGSLTGTEALLGPDGNPINTADTTIVTNYELVPGQTEESDFGLYLDFTSASNPQPIRGTFGGTDPGPS